MRTDAATRRLLRDLLAEDPKGKLRLVGAILLSAAASGASVALMGLAAWLLSRAAEFPPVLYLEAAAVGVRFFGISRGVFRYLERLVGHDVALRMQAALRLRTYTSLAKTTLIGRRRGDLLVRVIADVEAILDLVVRVIIPFCAASLVITGTTLMLARFSVGSALVLFASAVVAGLLLPWLTQRLSEATESAAAPTRGALADQIREIARTSTDLVAYGEQDRYLAQILETDAQLRRIEQRGAWIRGLATAGQLVAAGISVAAAILIGGQAVADGQLAPRLLAVLVLTPLALHEVLAAFTQAAQTQTRASASLRRLVEVLDAPAVGRGDVPTEAAAEPLIELRDATIGWPGAAPVATDFNLHVAPGDRVALIGTSGIGKTTVAATVMGLIPPHSGTVETAGRIGYLAQDAHIFATTVAENVRIGNRDADESAINDALRLAGLPMEPDRLIGEAGSTLSGGEARRLALARVLVADRDAWILDEPTEHLDAETATALMADIWRVAGERPVLVITHDPEVISACERVVRMSPAAAQR